MDTLIRLKATGSPKTFAGKIGISERTLFEYLNVLKELGADISYSKAAQSYFYIIEKKFVFGYQ
jgi:predicted DNA-binding transcriptional regulator YafY